VVNVVNIFVCNYFKSFFLESGIVILNNNSNQEDSLEEMLSLVDDSQYISWVQNVE